MWIAACPRGLVLMMRRLAWCIRVLAVCSPLWLVGEVQAVNVPALILVPDNGPCGVPITARGEHFPPGRTVALNGPFSPAGRSLGSSGPALVTTVAYDGTFTLDLLPCGSFTPVVTPEIVFSASTYPPSESPQVGATATFRVAFPGLPNTGDGARGQVPSLARLLATGGVLGGLGGLAFTLCGSGRRRRGAR